MNQIKDLRLLLHSNIYSNYINELLDMINNEFDPFSATYDDNYKTITIKIKKTNMRKNSSYEHKSYYYYSIMNPILSTFIGNHYGEIVHHIPESININENISMLYSVTVIGDNIVNIIL